MVFGSLLIALLRHADRVTVACLAQLVNVIAPIMTEPGGPAWRQTTFYPFAQAAGYGRGGCCASRCDSPTYDTARLRRGAAAARHRRHDDETGDVTVFAVNRGQTDALPLRDRPAAASTADTASSSTASWPTPTRRPATPSTGPSASPRTPARARPSRTASCAPYSNRCPGT